jgi:hypothetical protein
MFVDINFLQLSSDVSVALKRKETLQFKESYLYDYVSG